MNHDIFISYSRRDLAAVKPIKEELEAQGFSCWMDLEGIESGVDSFKRVVIPAINGSTSVLFFISLASQQSEYGLKEINFAHRKGKRVILGRINDDNLTDDFSFDFGDADIIDWRKPEQREKLFRDLGKKANSQYARCSKERLEKALRERGEWDAVKKFMEENDIWTAYKFANRIDEEHKLTQKTLSWLKKNRGYSNEQIESLLKECREPRTFTKLSIYQALEKRGLWKETEAQLRTTGLMDLFESLTNISEDDIRFLPIVEWLRRQGVDVEAIWAEAEIIPM